MDEMEAPTAGVAARESVLQKHSRYILAQFFRPSAGPQQEAWRHKRGATFQGLMTDLRAGAGRGKREGGKGGREGRGTQRRSDWMAS